MSGTIPPRKVVGCLRGKPLHLVKLTKEQMDVLEDNPIVPSRLDSVDWIYLGETAEEAVIYTTDPWAFK